MRNGDIEELEDSDRPGGFDLAGWWAARQLRLTIAHRVCLVFAYATALLVVLSARLDGKLAGTVGAVVGLFIEQHPVSAVLSLAGAGALVAAAHLSVSLGHQLAFMRVLFDLTFAAVLAIGVVLPVLAALTLPAGLAVLMFLAAIGTAAGLVLAAH